MSDTTIKTGIMAVWEEYEVEIELNKDISDSYYRPYHCKHVVNGHLPRVVVAYNEAGHNTTGVCLDCLLEFVASHNQAPGEGQS